MKTERQQAIDRVKVLMNEPCLATSPENIFVNAPTAIHQIAWFNELNGILYGLGWGVLRIKELPITKNHKKLINSVIKESNP